MFRRSLPACCNCKIAPTQLLRCLREKHSVDTYFGVPDSVLKDFGAQLVLAEREEKLRHTITCNEGSAVAMATGYHLASGKVPAVYMQNSGFGNAVNPLLSLTHREVYKIPMLLIVGWRGDDTKPDEPQHYAQGRLMKECFAACEVPYEILSSNSTEGFEPVLDRAFHHILHRGSPFALLVKRDTFTNVDFPNAPSSKLSLSREEALEAIAAVLPDDAIIVSTTGNASRELFEIRVRTNAGHHREFLTVGSMGHCSAIAAGIATEKPNRQVYCIDGDGASIMHLGAYAVNGGIGKARGGLGNLKHILLNNACHDSTGGGETVGHHVNMTGIAHECGYNTPMPTPASTMQQLQDGMQQILFAGDGPTFLEVLVKKGNRKDLGRPTTTPIQNKLAFMDHVQKH